MADFCVVLVTYPARREAQKAARLLVQNKLAACVSIIPGVSSFYSWKGKRVRSSEVLALAKTRRRLVPKLIRFVRSHHSYACPEILALPVAAGSPGYLDWVRKGTRA